MVLRQKYLFSILIQYDTLCVMAPILYVICDLIIHLVELLILGLHKISGTNFASNYSQLSPKKNEISISLHSHSTLIQYFHNIATKHSTMDYLKPPPTTIP